MKKYHALFAVALTALLASCGTSSSSSSEISSSSSLPSYDPYAVNSFVERNLPMYAVGLDPTQTKVMSEIKGCIRVYSVNGSSIPYVSFSEYISNFCTLGEISSDYSDFILSYDGDVYTLQNPVNDALLTIDFKEKIATYTDYTNFFST